METSALLDSLKAARRVRSDYALARLLGLSPGAISNYRSGRSVLTERVAIHVADLLGLDRGAVLAAIAAERARRVGQVDVAAEWERVSKCLGAKNGAFRGK